MTTTMTAAPPLYRTSIGKKWLMATSGVVLYAFIIAHLVGNLKLWLNATQFNAYAEWLRRFGDPPLPHTWLLWIIRMAVLVAFVTHVYFAIETTVRSRRARASRYAHSDHVSKVPANVTMRWGGLTLFLFVIFHLANFTWGWIHPGYTYVRGHVYQNVVGAFNVWWMDLIYIAALAALALHLYHGTWSMFQTYGVTTRRWDPLIRRTAVTASVVIFVGYASLPIGVLVGAIY